MGPRQLTVRALPLLLPDLSATTATTASATTASATLLMLAHVASRAVSSHVAAFFFLSCVRVVLSGNPMR